MQSREFAETRTCRLGTYFLLSSSASWFTQALSPWSRIGALRKQSCRVLPRDRSHSWPRAPTTSQVLWSYSPWSHGFYNRNCKIWFVFIMFNGMCFMTRRKVIRECGRARNAQGWRKAGPRGLCGNNNLGQPPYIMLLPLDALKLVWNLSKTLFARTYQNHHPS